MSDLRERADELLEQRPEIESDLREVLAVDAEQDGWEFQDVPLDSGDFGEVVSRGIAEEGESGYRVTDRDALRAAIEGESAPGDEGDSAGDPGSDADASESPKPSVSLDGLLPSVDRRATAALAGALALLAAIRLVPFPAVFRDGDTVLYPNDPYLYRHWVDLTTETASGVLDVGAFTNLKEFAGTGEPLFVASTAWLAELLGGGAGASGTVLAWYPIVVGVLTGVMVYALTRTVTDDRRVAVAAVLLLAVTPMHAFRTGLGFGDHHAFDYLWLGATAVGLVSVLGDGDRFSWRGTALLAAGVAGQTLAWEAGPLLTLPVVAVAAFASVSAVRAGNSPLSETGGVVAGVGVGAALVGFAHLAFGWHDTTIAVVPGLLFLGCLGAVLVAEVGHRRGLSAGVTFGSQVGLGVVGTATTLVLAPDVLGLLVRRLDFLLFREGVRETGSLAGGQLGAIVGPLYNFGLVFLLAIPLLAWATVRAVRSHEPRWTAVVTFAWYFLVLSLVQVRFAGELGLFLTLFAGLAFVRVAAWVDVARLPRPMAGESPRADGGDSRSFEWPGTRTVAYFVVFWLILASPGIAVSLGYVGNSTIPADRYGATDEMRTYAADRSLSESNADRYVLSRWDHNRVYNYFVSGESRSYIYAREQFPESLATTDPGAWYRNYTSRVGFVVIDREFVNGSSEELYQRLESDYGSRSEAGPGLAHYRAVYDRGDTVAYRLVPGAKVTGTGPASTTLNLSASVSIRGAEFTYHRQVHTDANGSFDVRVAYPGEYQLGDATVEVPEAAVENGTEVEVSEFGARVANPGGIGRASDVSEEYSRWRPRVTGE